MSQLTPGATREQLAAALTRLWWLPLVRGVLLIVLGGYALFRPGMTAAAFTQVIGIFLIGDGVLAIVSGLLGETQFRLWAILRGVLLIAVGAFVFGHAAVVTGVTVTVIMYTIAIGVITGGLLEIVTAVRERKQLEGEGWLMLAGALAVLFGLLLMAAPLSFGLLIVRIIGVYAIFFGVALIVFAFKMRRFGKALRP
jgi:uncharacterized membrane protein HdeD (DUF308 family)